MNPDQAKFIESLRDYRDHIGRRQNDRMANTLKVLRIARAHVLCYIFTFFHNDSSTFMQAESLSLSRGPPGLQTSANGKKTSGRTTLFPMVPRADRVAMPPKRSSIVSDYILDRLAYNSINDIHMQSPLAPNRLEGQRLSTSRPTLTHDNDKGNSFTSDNAVGGSRKDSPRMANVDTRNSLAQSVHQVCVDSLSFAFIRISLAVVVALFCNLGS